MLGRPQQARRLPACPGQCHLSKAPVLSWTPAPAQTAAPCWDYFRLRSPVHGRQWEMVNRWRRALGSHACKKFETTSRAVSAPSMPRILRQASSRTGECSFLSMQQVGEKTKHDTMTRENVHVLAACCGPRAAVGSWRWNCMGLECGGASQ